MRSVAVFTYEAVTRAVTFSAKWRVALPRNDVRPRSEFDKMIPSWESRLTFK